MRFAQGLQKLTDQLWNTFVELLTSEWLVVDIDEPEEDSLFFNGEPHETALFSERWLIWRAAAERRLLELKRIRCAYLPELVFRLHSALVLSGEDFVPRCVASLLYLCWRRLNVLVQ